MSDGESVQRSATWQVAPDDRLLETLRGERWEVTADARGEARCVAQVLTVSGAATDTGRWGAGLAV